jgi:O-antigen/teichoic acid export membrane protein
VDQTVVASSARPVTTARTSEDDRGSARAVAVGASAQLVARAVNLALNVVVGLALVRYFSTAAYGDYVFVLSFSALFGLLGDFGLAKVAVRDMSQRPTASGTVLGTAIALRLGLCLVSFGLAQLTLVALGTRAELRPAVAVASLLFVSDALLSIVAVFQVQLANQWEALTTLVIQLCDTALIFWLIGQQAGLLAILSAPVVSAGVGIAVAATIARARFRATLAFDARLLPGLAQAALPLGISGLLATLYVKLDMVMLGVMAPPGDVGIYAASAKPVEYLLLVGVMLVQLLFPLLARNYTVDPARFQKVYQRGLQALLALMLPVPIVAAFIADPLVLALYTPDFAHSAVPLRILSVALAVFTLAAWQSFTLLAAGRQSIALVYDGAALGLNLGLNLLLIAWIGYVGAALTAVLTALFVFISASLVLWRVLGVILDLVMVLKVVLANVGLGATMAVAMATSLPWIVATTLAGTLYPALLVLCGVVTPGEVRQILRARSSHAI